MSNGRGVNSNRDDRDERAGSPSERPLDSIDRAKAAFKVGRYALAIGWLCSAIEEIVELPPPVPELKARARKQAIRERQRSGEASHGAPEGDAEVTGGGDV